MLARQLNKMGPQSVSRFSSARMDSPGISAQCKGRQVTFVWGGGSQPRVLLVVTALAKCLTGQLYPSDHGAAQGRTLGTVGGQCSLRHWSGLVAGQGLGGASPQAGWEQPPAQKR